MKCNSLCMLFWLVLILLLQKYSFTYKVLINDGKLGGWLTTGACTGGWSRDKTNETNVFIYSSCPVDTTQDCYLVSEYFSTQGANMVFAHFTMEIHRCLFAKVPGCLESLDTFIFTGSLLSSIDLSAVKNYFRPFTTIPTQALPAAVSRFEAFSSFVTVSGLAGKTGFYIAVRTRGYCGTMLALQLYFNKCPTVSEELANFPELPAPDESENAVKIDGRCTDHASPDGASKPLLTCYSDGHAVVQGSCRCDVGYTKSDKACVACPEGQFKDAAGNQPCTKCGTNVIVDREPRTCNCRDGYYRAIDLTSVLTADCYRPPSSVTRIQFSNVTSNGLVISWDPPSHDAFHGPVTYKLLCTNCPQNNRAFPRNTTSTSITIHDTGAFARYQIEIYSLNNITDLIGKNFSAASQFRTAPGIPGPVRDFQTELLSDGQVTVSWAPPFAEGGEDLKYKIAWGDAERIVAVSQFTIPTDVVYRAYTVSITPFTASGEGETYHRSLSVAGRLLRSITIGVTVAGVIAFVIVVLLVVFFVWRKRHPDHVHAVRLEDGTVKFVGGILSPRGKKAFVDPTNYENLDAAVAIVAHELQSADLRVGKLLGSGEFCDVYQGTLLKDGEEKQVAIKMLKSDASKSDRDDFLGEAAILGQFTDPNVIFLEGVILKDQPNMLVLEFMAFGSLEKYLHLCQATGVHLNTVELLRMALGVASGMTYLSELGFIHRDLAARNILVDENRVCKVADFGMSREIKVDDTYDSRGGKIPVRWTAPEAIQFRKFTTASDIWSYGVLLWEIMTCGKRPYWNWSNCEVIQGLKLGFRLPSPELCPKVVHDMMLHCWQKDPSQRPKFSSLYDKIDLWIKNPEHLTEVPSHNYANLGYEEFHATSTWLESIDMGCYVNIFIDHGYVSPTQISTLTLGDLEAMGIGSTEQRKRISKAISEGHGLCS